jgi:cytochrome c peroxidase
MHSTLRTLAWTVAALALAACGPQEGDAPPEDAGGTTGTMEAEETAADAAPAAEASLAAAPDPAALAERAATALGALPPVAEPEDYERTQARIDLGRMLYYDKRMSINDEIACNTCHLLDRYGVDNEPTSPGHEGRRGERNSPSTYNAAFHVAQFWDGRAADVEEQAKGPVLNPVEMGMPSEDYVLRVLRAIPGYEPLFEAAFPEADEPITYDHFAVAVGAFERGLVTPSRFDDFLEGDTGALSAQERKGLELFLDVGCITCHNGAPVGGLVYQKLGLVVPFESEDVGRMKVTGNEADEHVFKVPSLRNVAETHPYFHDGSVATLDEAVRLMGKHQLGKDLDDEQVALLLAFLESLTGRIDQEYVAEPKLPEAGPDMPAPSAL